MTESIVQYEQKDAITSSEDLEDSVASDNSKLTDLQLANIGNGLYGSHPISAISGKANELKGFDRINQSINTILHTLYGEVPMMYPLGSNLEKFLFEPIDSVLDDDISLAISDAINKEEMRVSVQDVVISHDEADMNKVNVEVTYILTNTNIQHVYHTTLITGNGSDVL